MSASIELDQKDLSRVSGLFSRLKGLDHDHDFLDVIGAIGNSQIQHRLRDQKSDPETGAAWLPLNKEYAAKKSETSSGGILDYTGELIDSANTWNILPEGGVEWGSNKVYAAAHHYGIEGKTPARPWLGFSTENLDEMHEVASDYIDDMVKKS